MEASTIKTKSTNPKKYSLNSKNPNYSSRTSEDKFRKLQSGQERNPTVKDSSLLINSSQGQRHHTAPQKTGFTNVLRESNWDTIDLAIDLLIWGITMWRTSRGSSAKPREISTPVRGWISANPIIFFQGQGSTTPIQTSFGIPLLIEPALLLPDPQL